MKVLSDGSPGLPWVKICIIGTVCASLAMFSTVGCSGTTNTSAENGTDGSTSTTNLAEWRAQHPAEYYSFLEGEKNTGGVSINGEPVGHTNMYASMTASPENSFFGPLDRDGCFACKTSQFNNWVEENGDEVYDMTSGQYSIDKLTEEDCWDCLLCHDDINDPVGTIGANAYHWNTYSPTLAASLDAKTAVCVQCHQGNDASTQWQNLVSESETNEETFDFDITKYGTTPDDILKRYNELYVERGLEKSVIDEDTGLYIYAGIDGDVFNTAEAFIGSPMQQMGVTCADCHMTTSTGVDGETYTSHDASGSPLENEEAMQYCLTCHEGQGITTTADMVAYVEGLQADLKVRLDQTATRLDELSAAISEAVASGSIDDATLEQVRKAYADAHFYRSYCQVMHEGGKYVETGTRVVHNPTGFNQYLDQSDNIIADTMALLGK